MAELNGQAAETREFLLPITLTVGEREVEIPLSVQVTFDQLTEIVNRHLQSGADVYADLLELYAEQAGRKRGRSKPAPPESPAPGGRTRSRKKSAAGADGNGTAEP
jgi:hypothetical protein